jgi:hypothetical protein
MSKVNLSRVPAAHQSEAATTGRCCGRDLRTTELTAKTCNQRSVIDAANTIAFFNQPTSAEFWPGRKPASGLDLSIRDAAHRSYGRWQSAASVPSAMPSNIIFNLMELTGYGAVCARAATIALTNGFM